MPWFKVDDRLPDHRKIRRLGKDKVAGAGLWMLCGAWASGNGTDGFVPAEIVRRDDPRERLAGRLVEVKLWCRDEVDGEPGYRFHDWPDWNPTQEQREREREATRLRVAEHRARKNGKTRNASSNAVTNGGRSGVSNAEVPDPGPPAVPTGQLPDPARPARDAHAGAREAIDRLLPKAVGAGTRKRVATQCDAALERGVPLSAVETAVEAWANRPGAQVGLMPFLIDDAVRDHHAAAHNGHARPGADTKVAGWAAVRDELQARQNGGSAHVIQLPPGSAS